MTPTDTGKASEYTFCARCIEENIFVNFPCSEMLPYDFVCYSGPGRLSLVQVKGTKIEKSDGSLRVHCALSDGKGRKRKYTKDDCDFIVFYLEPRDLFYIVPIEEIQAYNVTFRPDKEDEKYGVYKENWDLLREHKR